MFKMQPVFHSYVRINIMPFQIKRFNVFKLLKQRESTSHIAVVLFSFVVI